MACKLRNLDEPLLELAESRGQIAQSFPEMARIYMGAFDLNTMLKPQLFSNRRPE